MTNDTAGPDSPDSQLPFMREGNEAGGESVADHMSDTTRTPAAPSSEAASPEATAPITPEDTGDMDAVVPAIEPAMTSEPAAASEAVPTTEYGDIDAAPFDYDAYYADAAPWPVEPVPATPEPEPRRRDGVLFFVGALAAALVGSALTVGLLAASGTLTNEDAEPAAAAVAAPAVVNDEPAAPAPVIENTIVNELGAAVNPTAVAVKTVPSIVTVSTFGSDQNGFGSGSGVVLTEDGYIATNEHVVDGAASWQVTFEDGRVYEADLIGSDPLTDLAVLKIDADDLVAIDLGSSDELALGDPAVAVGNPLGQEGGSSISVGIVSAFDRRVDFGDGTALVGMIQTDAAINSGSSGGALVNAEGELIGITAAIGVSNAGPEGIGYAIPVEVVERITAEIIETGDVVHPFLGVTIGNYSETLADGGVIPAGALIDSIEGGGSAAGAAGLQEGDVIVQIGDEDIVSQNDLILAVRLYRVGDTVDFVAIRDGQPITVSVVMGERPAEFGG
ncbi:MAG: trypsin-like peptidase domain-containing protein [Acidimicrobiia bacterium]|nr:trypsin-like peptidase domain-containing protein [Acidimicrobiia bacterium]